MSAKTEQGGRVDEAVKAVISLGLVWDGRGWVVPPAIPSKKVGVVDACSNDDSGRELAAKHHLFIYEVDFGDEGKGRYIRLGDFNKVVAKLEAALAQNAQGEAAGCAEGKFTAEQYEARALELRNERLGPHWSKDAEMMEQSASLIRDQSKIVDAEPVEFDYPDFHVQGMGCGLEDRGITDRYEAMRYGWDDALDQMARIIDSMGPLYTHAERARVPQEWRSLLANLAAVVRVQNGNRHDDTNRLLDHADRLLAVQPDTTGATP